MQKTTLISTQRPIPGNVATRVALTVLLIGLLAGCSDMPTITPKPVEPPLEVTVGPYLSLASGKRLIIHFETNRPTTAAIRFVAENRQRVYREGLRRRQHRLPMDALPLGSLRAQILLDDKPFKSIVLRGHVAPNTPVLLAFTGGGAGRSDMLKAAGTMLQSADPDGIVFTGGMAPQIPTRQAWKNEFFDPLGNIGCRSRYFFLPGTVNDPSMQLLPGLIPPNARWSQQIGPVYLIAFDSRMLRSSAQRTDLIAWLEKSLSSRPPETAWTVVTLSEPLVGAKYLNVRALESLGALFEKNAVDLIVSGGAQYYHRTLPLKDNDAFPVRYAVTSGLDVGEAANSGRSYTAALSSEPHLCFLRATPDSLEWRVINLQGGMVDAFHVNRNHRETTNESVLDKHNVLTAVLAEQLLQHEILLAGRQVCRAVDDLAASQRLPIILANPSTRPFDGTLSWAQAETSAWTVTPPEMRFHLEPGQKARADFRLTPSDPSGTMPVLRVEAPGIGRHTQPLFLTSRQSTDVYLSNIPITLDGYFTEAFWAEAKELDGFVVHGTGEAPTRVLRSRISALEHGLALAIRCEVEGAASIPVQVKHDDGPVHRDESVEIFLDPQQTGREYYQLAINVRNIALDRSRREGLAWSPKWQHAVQYQKDFYDVEIFIPYQSLSMSAPKAGDTWGFNLARNDYAPLAKSDDGDTPPSPMDAPEIVQWVRTHGSNARSGLYGQLRFCIRPDAASRP